MSQEWQWCPRGGRGTQSQPDLQGLDTASQGCPHCPDSSHDARGMAVMSQGGRGTWRQGTGRGTGNLRLREPELHHPPPPPPALLQWRQHFGADVGSQPGLKWHPTPPCPPSQPAQCHPWDARPHLSFGTDAGAVPVANEGGGSIPGGLQRPSNPGVWVGAGQCPLTPQGDPPGWGVASSAVSHPASHPVTQGPAIHPHGRSATHAPCPVLPATLGCHRPRHRDPHRARAARGHPNPYPLLAHGWDTGGDGGPLGPTVWHYIPPWRKGWGAAGGS